MKCSGSPSSAGRLLKNGDLLSQAAANGFEALITKDQGVEHEQNLASLPLSVVVLRARADCSSLYRPFVHGCDGCGVFAPQRISFSIRFVAHPCLRRSHGQLARYTELQTALRPTKLTTSGRWFPNCSPHSRRERPAHVFESLKDLIGTDGCGQ